MKQFFLKTTLLLIFITFFNCSNNDDSIEQNQLPPITQTGANTFGCVINGEVLIPKDSRGSLGGVSPKKGITVAYLQNNNFTIDAGNFRDENGDRIYIYINNLVSIGTYSFGLSNGESTSTFEPDYPHCWGTTFNNLGEGKKHLSNTNSGTIKITRFDQDNHIISGTFELTVFNRENPTETIEITDGRFDINLNTVNN
jgi:hypothetical protein